MTSKIASQTIELKRTYGVPLATLYGLCASPGFFRLTGVTTTTGSMDFREGGRYSYEIPGVSRVWGAFVKIVPEREIVLTWSTDHPHGPCHDTTLQLLFRADGAGSELHLRHSGFGDARAFESHDGGWREIFADLDEELRGRLGAATAPTLAP